MDQNRVFVRRALHKLLPASIIGEVACFVFYDHHPRDKTRLDVTVCTNSGEILEYYHHELISSLLIETVGHTTDIKILRNSNCELFYLVVLSGEIVIISRKDGLQVHNRVGNVDSFTIDDVECTGLARLRIIRNDDAVPLVFDDNFIILSQSQIDLPNNQTEESPIVKQLMQKLTEAKYTTKHNELKYKDYVNMRQAAAFALYQKATFNLDNAVSTLKLGLSEVSNLLKVSVKEPVIKMCNKKVVMLIKLTNNNNVSIKDVHILFHSDFKQSIEYRTRVFVNTTKSPFWKETDAVIASHNESMLAAVIDLDELQFDETSRINLDVALSFTKSNKTHLMTLESVSIRPLDMMGENFDILYSNVDNNYLVLCIISTSECFDLHLRHITESNDIVTLSDIFHTHLKMDMCLEKLAIHKAKPFHKLHGVVVVFEDNIQGTDIMHVKVYTRFPSQVLALMHYIYDVVPYRIIVTTSDYKISGMGFSLSNYTETPHNKPTNYTECAASIVKQIKIIKEYIDECTAKMMEDGSSEMEDKIGTEVDLMASGVPKFLEFRKKILEESLKGVKSVMSPDDQSSENDMDCMIIDDDA
ncbi:uncharacterized protein LOC112053336 [Bicyclus anynana]|uniref:Uncharacterized protein LOC112053336 n=1 Tax=Bicyclus anynana TaxID=110368 RepID=A0A6J1NL53_BICAN|nr:uncharacterized protein LOC112053336 [Bicyclus anynana]